MMWPVAAMASLVRSDRKAVGQKNPWRQLEQKSSEMITASWNLYRDLRDAGSEAAFFQIFGSMITLGATGDVKPGRQSRSSNIRIPANYLLSRRH